MARKPKPSGRKKRARRQDSYARGYGFREIRRRILIVCEGEKTEPHYFDALRRLYRLGTVAVVIRDCNRRTAPEQIVDFAIRCREEDPDIDEVWCVFDSESAGERQSFNRAVEIARSYSLGLAVSNPAFEYWLLLHFAFTSRPFCDGAEVLTELRSHLQDYDKGYSKFGTVLGAIESAARRAERVLEQSVDRSFAPNPSTYVQRLTQKLKEMALQ